MVNTRRKRRCDETGTTSKYFKLKHQKSDSTLVTESESLENKHEKINGENLNALQSEKESESNFSKSESENRLLKIQNEISNEDESDTHFQKLTRSDFQKSSIDLAKYLLGKIILHIDNDKILSGRIVETEAYLGETDKACHTYGGKKTNRTKPMYMAEGSSYVYSIYGMYHCLNISSSDVGGCVLIRALEPLKGLSTMKTNRSLKRKETSRQLRTHELCNGPSKLCQALNINKANLNSVDMATSPQFYAVSDGLCCANNDIVACKRVGIDGYGEEAACQPYRFYMRGDENVSVRICAL